MRSKRILSKSDLSILILNLLAGFIGESYTSGWKRNQLKINSSDKLSKQKGIIFLTLLVLQNFGAIAQRFKAGAQLGFTANDVYGADIVPDADAWNDTQFNKPGFMIGGHVNTTLGKRTLLQMEINYIRKGTQQSSDSIGSGFYKFSFDYVEVPLLVKYRIHLLKDEKTKNTFEFYGGMAAGKLIKSKAEGTNFHSTDDFSYLNRTDVSLLLGMGYNFFEHFNLSARYSNSLIPVFKRLNAPVFFAQSLNVGNSISFQFILQYTFGTKGNVPPADEGAD